MRNSIAFFSIVTLSLLFLSSSAFQSDELLLDDDEFEGEVKPPSPSLPLQEPLSTTKSSPTRKRSSDPDSDSKIQFSLEHAFGDSDFTPAGSFSARLKPFNHGGLTLTKLRFSRDTLTELEKEKFTKLLQDDGFYRIRLPSNVLSPPGREYIISSVKARCLSRESLDELFVIHTDGSNILGVNYGSAGSCQYPRQLKLPVKWSFTSNTLLKNSERAQRTPMFAEEISVGEGVEGEIIQPPERSFWAKYWMYLVPLGLIVMNVVTQAMNMPEEQATGQPGAQPTAAVQRGPGPAVRRR